MRRGLFAGCAAVLFTLGVLTPACAGSPPGDATAATPAPPPARAHQAPSMDARGRYLPFVTRDSATPVETCLTPFAPVSTPLTDLGNAEYIRMGTISTGFRGGLYPNGANVRPPAHEAAGLAAAGQIEPRDADGHPNPNGKIGMVSVGMSNTSTEFSAFIESAAARDDINPHLVMVNGALANQTAEKWADPNGVPWVALDSTLNRAKLTDAQVQVVWIKLTYARGGAFPDRALQLQGDLTAITHILNARFPNLKIIFLSSRTRSFNIYRGLSPEPSAYETGFAVKWLIEAQINGNPALNYDPARGPVTSPYLSWGPYLWIDGLNPRSDGRVWIGDDLTRDCTHPTPAGVGKVVTMLMGFYTTDSLARIWFLE